MPQGTQDETVAGQGGWGALDALPGNPMMWVLIISELLVFGGFLLSFSFARVLSREEFLHSQAQLDSFAGGINTAILVTSGLFCALAALMIEARRVRATRLLLGLAIALGVLFCAIKLNEYGAKFESGIGMSTNTFFTLFFLMTGFHFLHVILGMILLAIAAWRPSVALVETVCAFWHMVDLIWVLIYPIVYLVR